MMGYIRHGRPGTKLYAIRCRRRTGDRSQMTEKVSRGVPGTRLHSSSHRRRGSIGMTRSTRYTLVPRSLASASNAVSGLQNVNASVTSLAVGSVEFDAVHQVLARAAQLSFCVQRRARPVTGILDVRVQICCLASGIVVRPLYQACTRLKVEVTIVQDPPDTVASVHLQQAVNQVHDMSHDPSTHMTKWLTSAVCTTTRKLPPGSRCTLSAC